MSLRSLVISFVVLAVTGTSVALAADTLQDETVQFTVTPGANLSRSATCHTGREVVAGGFFAEVSDTAMVLPVDSQWDNAQRWALRAANLGTTEGRAIGYAYCTKPPIVDVIRPGFGRLPPGGTGSAQRSCRADHGEVAVAGDFEMTDNQPAYPLVSKLVDKRTWKAVAFNPNGGEGSISADVLCDIRDPRLPILTRSQSTIVQTGSSGKALADCKPREKLISGGFEAQPSTAPGGSGFVHASRRRGKRAWQAMARAIGGPLKLTAYAYCVRPD
jgi:hypothetical protein